MVLFNNLPRIGGETPIIPLPPHSRTFGENSWETISLCSSVIEQQQMTNAEVAYNFGWYPGDLKSIDMGGTNFTMRILGFSHDDRAIGTTIVGKAGISLELAPMLLHANWRMNSTLTNQGGWSSSTIRQTQNQLPSYISTHLPRDLVAVIKTAAKHTSRGANAHTLGTTFDNLWLLSAVEVQGGNPANTVQGEGSRYAYYTMTLSESAIARRRINASGQNIHWWTRSAMTTRNDRFMLYSHNTNNGTYALASANANGQNGVSFGLCV